MTFDRKFPYRRLMVFAVGRVPDGWRVRPDFLWVMIGRGYVVAEFMG